MAHVCRECGTLLYEGAGHQGKDSKVKSLRSPEAVNKLCRRMVNLDQEHFRVLALDVRLNLIAAKTVAIGSLVACPVEPREVFRFAIQTGAHAVVCVHNHPSGDPAPSHEDQELTRRLREAGELVGIRLTDHVIVARRGWWSFTQERGR